MDKKQKVFVRGMKDYGFAVIQLLERLGGINANELTGTKSENIYFIRHNRIIDCTLKPIVRWRTSSWMSMNYYTHRSFATAPLWCGRLMLNTVKRPMLLCAEPHTAL